MKRFGFALAFFLSLVGGAFAQGGMGPGPGMVHSTGGGGGPVAITQTDHGESATDSNTYTFTARALGTAQADRRIIVALSMRVAGTTTTVSSVTVAGISATQVVSSPNNGGGNTTLAELWVAAVPTGTTGDVVITFSATVLRCGSNVWRMVGSASSTASATGTSTADPGTANLTIPANGAAVGFAVADFAGSGQGVNWTNLTSSLALTYPEGAFGNAGAMADFVGGGSTTLTADYTASTSITTPSAVFAAWAP